MIRINKAAILYALFEIVFIGGHVLELQPLVANFMIAAVGVATLGTIFLEEGIQGKNTNLILVGMLYSAFMIISIIYNGNADYTDLLWVWAYMGIAVLTYNYEIPQWLYWGSAYAFITWLLIYIVRGGAPEEFLSMGSQNNISAYVIFFVIMSYLSVMHKKREVQYLAGILTLAISLWSSSRAGIISSFLLLIGTFLYNFIAIRGQKLKALLKWSALIVFAIWIVNNFFGKYLLGLTEKINRYGNGSIRSEIWLEYIQGTAGNIGNFFFGVNTSNETYRWLSYYDGNTHNSFLMLHAKFGIVAFLMLVALIFLVIRKTIKERDYLLVVVLLASSIRMFFDWIAFPGLYDVLFWYMYLYILDRHDYEVGERIYD